MKINKSTVTCISIAVGSVMLATAAFANFVTANGYNIYKSAVKDLLQERNYTLSISYAVTLDGEYIDELESFYEEIDLDTAVYSKTVGKTQSGDETVSENYTAAAVGDYINKTNYSYGAKGEKIITAPTANIDDVYSHSVRGTLARDYDESELDTLEKTINFVETAADLCVGDLKNNFVYLQDTDVGHEYQITVDSFQIPEIINAGLAVIGSQLKSNAEAAYNSSVSTDNPIYSIYDDLRGKGGTCRIVVDNYGRLRENDITIDLVGSDAGGIEHTLSLVCIIRIDKYDETVPQEIDLSDCVEVTYQSEQYKERIAELLQEYEQTTDEAARRQYKIQIDSMQTALNHMDTKAERAATESAESVEIIDGTDVPTEMYIE